MIKKYFKPGGNTIKWAGKISYYAHLPWVLAVFFIVFFLDSFLFFVPADGLLAVAILFTPARKRLWFFMSVAGSVAGFLLFYFLMISSFHLAVIDFIVKYDTQFFFQHIITHAAKYGYFDLSIAVFTFVPPGICLVGGIVIGLHPSVVFFIVCFSKVVRILTVIYVVKKTWVAVILIKHRIKKRQDEKNQPHHNSNSPM